jgi:hypothetical protein
VYPTPETARGGASFSGGLEVRLRVPISLAMGSSPAGARVP